MADSVMNVRWHIYFLGRVQGVGFRYTCKTVAQRYAVSGWVKNLSDGSVEMVVEGQRAAIRSYVDDVCDSTHGRVEDIQVSKTDGTNEFRGFGISY